MFEAIADIVASGGHWAVFLMMVLENIFPPIPSELIMPLGGFLAADGRLTLWGVILAGTAGSLLGATLWYVLGRAIGPVRFLALVDKIGPWLTLDRAEALAAIHWFERHGPRAVFVGRMLPTARTLISVPAGLSGMPFWPFIGWSAAGTLVWVTGLALAGYLLQSQYDRVQAVLDPAALIVLGSGIAIYLYRVVRRLRR
jgi:membrane protein DedA with SNARE-associated domain